MEVITTTKGKPCLVMDGHRYRVHRKTCLYTNWLCVNSERSKCRGRLKTADDRIMAEQEHSCSPDEVDVQIQKRMHNCRKRVREENAVPVCRIFREEFRDLKDNGLGFVPKVPNYENSKTALCKARRGALKRTQNLCSSSGIQLDDVASTEEGRKAQKRKDIEVKEEYAETDTDPLSTNNNQVPEETRGKTIPTIRRRRNPQELVEAGHTLNQALGTLNKALLQQEKKYLGEDECDLYGKLLAKKLRRLPYDERLRFMHEIDGMFIRHLSGSSFSPSPAGHQMRPGSASSSHSEAMPLDHRI